MPELPEVKWLVDQLNQYITGRTITEIEPGKTKATNFEKASVHKALLGASFNRIEHFGKLMLLHLAEHDEVVHMHLRFGGRVLLDAEEGPLADAHLVARLRFDDGHTLTFKDFQLGYVELLSAEASRQALAAFNPGPEALSEGFSADYLWEAIEGRSVGIKEVLQNQHIVTGIGNIYATEALWTCQLHPRQPANTLKRAELESLVVTLRSQLQSAYEAHGVAGDFRDLLGQPGAYGEELQVMWKQEQPCPRCQNLIEKIKVAGRGTYICPFCQQLRRRLPREKQR